MTNCVTNNGNSVCCDGCDVPFWSVDDGLAVVGGAELCVACVVKWPGGPTVIEPVSGEPSVITARDSVAQLSAVLAAIPLVTTDSRIDLIEQAITLAADVVSALNNMRRFEVSQFES